MLTPRSPLEACPLVALLALSGSVLGQNAASGEIPAALNPPAGEHLVLKTHAVGSQIYVCSQGTDGKPQWTLKAPDAELRDAKGAIIRHYAGPSWKHQDGSEVTGKAVAKVPSPDPESIPWLLLSAVGHEGKGALEHVSSIQRIHTKGGLPPPADHCAASQQNAEAMSRYSADYYFYAPGG